MSSHHQESSNNSRFALSRMDPQCIFASKFFSALSHVGHATCRAHDSVTWRVLMVGLSNKRLFLHQYMLIKDPSSTSLLICSRQNSGCQGVGACAYCLTAVRCYVKHWSIAFLSTLRVSSQTNRRPSSWRCGSCHMWALCLDHSTCSVLGSNACVRQTS